MQIFIALTILMGEGGGGLASDLQREAPRIERPVLQKALAASSCAAAQGVPVQSPLLTVIDYSKPSVEPRLWVFDLEKRKLLFEELVAHGQGSGENLARRFSNELGSLMTSLGLFRTGGIYQGRNGYTMKLEGLEPGYNDRSGVRAIVMHGAAYVSEAIAQKLGRLGRSWGCPAVRQEVARKLIDTIRDGSLVFAYYPDAGWQKESKFLNCGR